MKTYIKMKYGIFLMLLSSVCACFGQLLWKFFTQNQSVFFLIGGFFLYGCGALLMIIAYHFGPLSVLQPILSFNYVLAILLATFILKENMSAYNYIGVLSVILGIVFIATGKHNAD